MFLPCSAPLGAILDLSILLKESLSDSMNALLHGPLMIDSGHGPFHLFLFLSSSSDINET